MNTEFEMGKKCIPVVFISRSESIGFRYVAAGVQCYFCECNVVFVPLFSNDAHKITQNN